MGFAASYPPEKMDQMIEDGKLPGFCEYAGSQRWPKSQKGRKFFSTYGPSWNTMHHFCWALIDAQGGKDREALANLRYVLNNIGKNSKLRPNVLAYKANILIVNGRDSEAVPVFYEMIHLNPSGEGGYVGLANILSRQGDKKTASEIAKLGLGKIPNSNVLKSFLD